MVIAMQWVAQITSIGFELVVPVAVGYWLDERWGTGPWLLIVGALVGPAIAFMHLLQLAAAAKKETDSHRGPRT